MSIVHCEFYTRTWKCLGKFNFEFKLPIILLSIVASSSFSRWMASAEGKGAAGKVTSTILMLSLLPCKSIIHNEARLQINILKNFLKNGPRKLNSLGTEKVLTAISF